MIDKEKRQQLTDMIAEMNAELAERQHQREILQRRLHALSKDNPPTMIDERGKQALIILMKRDALSAQDAGKRRAEEFRKRLLIDNSPKLSRAALVSNKKRNRIML